MKAFGAGSGDAMLLIETGVQVGQSRETARRIVKQAPIKNKNARNVNSNRRELDLNQNWRHDLLHNPFKDNSSLK